jgi:hypothetical protein
MAEQQGNRDPIQRFDREPGPGIPGREESDATGSRPRPDSTRARRDKDLDPDTSAEGRDRPPSDRGRDPKGPWLGGG